MSAEVQSSSLPLKQVQNNTERRNMHCWTLAGGQSAVEKASFTKNWASSCLCCRNILTTVPGLFSSKNTSWFGRVRWFEISAISPERWSEWQWFGFPGIHLTGRSWPSWRSWESCLDWWSCWVQEPTGSQCMKGLVCDWWSPSCWWHAVDKLKNTTNTHTRHEVRRTGQDRFLWFSKRKDATKRSRHWLPPDVIQQLHRLEYEFHMYKMMWTSCMSTSHTTDFLPLCPSFTKKYEKRKSFEWQ